MKKVFEITTIFLFLFFFITTSSAFAHVVVKPSEVETAAFQTFSVGVPNEKDNPTISVKLLIPSGLMHVTPNVKPGWTIEIKKSSDNVTEIIWSGGSIPAEQRDEFMFSAQAPADTTTLVWKVYQTYADGTAVSWDQKPEMEEHGDDEKEESKSGPASTTQVVNEIHPQAVVSSESSNKTPLFASLSGLSFILSVIALSIALRKKK